MVDIKILLMISALGLTSAAVLPVELPKDTETVLVPQLDGRIVGGSEVSIARHPHQAQLRHRTCEGCTYSHLCGGSIYTDRIIVTAAHCVYNRYANNYLIVAGTDKRSGAEGVVSRVDKIVMHENYNTSITDYDVALIFLSSELPIDGIKIATIELADSQPKNGAKSIVTGWGTTTESGLSSQKLLEVEVPIVSNEACNVAYGEGRITDAMLCAGVKDVGGKDACQGDSGGPLLVNWKLTGIVSWGRGCARPDYPGVYANVPYLKDWIQQIASDNM
ncbi:trypsin eta-like [Teleopsis dalmanni]|uniref:trypsin eta-like n=1 Tax=Teleopsis dalmanni TaxID=139649 RepID=UPI0018CD1B87|nr:trypsin eta-like [Teleopsis dalmanni]